MTFTREAAWDEVNKIFPYDYEKDELSSKNAGYPIYRCVVAEHFYNWISDLGDRLEVNTEDGKSVNVRIDTELNGMEIKIIFKDGQIMTYQKRDKAEVNYIDNGLAHKSFLFQYELF